MRIYFIIAINLIFIGFVQPVFAQMTIGEWRTHLPYSEPIRVAEAGEKIYCATQGGLFYYNKTDGALYKITKVDGLSDVGISCIAYYPEKSVLVISYTNANIDLIFENEIYNIPDIKRKQIPASKTINNILFLNGNAYLSCGFGIVVINIDKKEIKETYLIGENSGYKYVYDLEVDGNYFYAATESGIYRADINSSNLIDYNKWSRILDVPNYTKKFNLLTFFNGLLYANYLNEEGGVDTIYQFNGIKWEKYFNYPLLKNYAFEVNYDHLIIVNLWYTDVIDMYGARIKRQVSSHPFHAILDHENYIWVADYKEGLLRFDQSSNKQLFKPNGPLSARAVTMLFHSGKLYVAAGGDVRNWRNLYNHAEINVLNNNLWSGLDEIIYKDVVSLAVDPSDNTHFFAGTWGYGLLELKEIGGNDSITNVFDYTNSSLQNILAEGPYMRIGGLAYDNNSNLWMTNSEVQEPISVKKANGTWKSFAFGKKISGIMIGKLIITDYGHIWVQLLKGNGLFVFDVNGTIDEETDDEYKKIDVIDNNGKIITNNIYSLAEDRSGNIWTGTDQGIVVFYNAERVFNTNFFYGQQIIVPRNDGSGLADILLGTETVTAIAVDGANRKWIGTAKAGVFLVSDDGLEEIHHFTQENSPLYSNNIMDIVIDGKSGEVFFATDKGVISFKSTATDPNEYFNDVYVYPNPVRENYDGEIVITGLIKEVNVKITDISGNIVYETTSLGGQAIWDGKNFDGKKVSTGVYLIFCTNEDGSQTYITKLLIIN